MQVDYLQLWHDLAVQTPREPWGDLLKRYRRHAQQGVERSDPLLDFVINSLDPDYTVLDIGAGSGRWTLPLARKAHHITAVEPSDDMIAILEQNLAASRVENVKIVRSSWEEAAVEVHDVAVCAHAMYASPELANFVRKMEQYGRRACYLAMRLPAADGVIGRLHQTIYGTPHDSPNAVVAYNALYEMGIYCNVLVENGVYRWTDNNFEDAFTRAKRHLRLASNDKYDSLIRETLARRLQSTAGGYSWPDGMRSLLLWWQPGQAA